MRIPNLVGSAVDRVGDGGARLQVNINAECKQVIESAQKDGLSITEAVRRALSIYHYVRAVYKKGGHVEFVDAAGNRQKMTLAP